MSPTASPRILFYARIIMLEELTRLAGLNFLLSPGSLPTYFTLPFGVGDTLTGLTAIFAIWALGKPGSRRYALALVWSALGLADLVLAASISSISNLLPAISAQLGPALFLLPVSISVHVVVIVIFLTRRVSGYMNK